MKTKKEILDSYSNDMKGLLEFGNYSCVAIPYENALKAMEAYASEQTEKYKELIKLMDKLYDIACDTLYEHKIDPTGEMGKLYIKAQTLKTELGL